MSLQDKLSGELKAALRSGDRIRMGVLRMLLSELKVAQVAGREFDELAVVKAYAKKLSSSAEQYRKLNLPDRAAEALAERTVAEEFLPEQMGRGEIERLVTELIEQNDYGPGDLGALMKAVMSTHSDRVDGRVVQQIARERLADSG